MIDGKPLIALVPMKAHSERVPNKNVRPFFAEPLYFRILHTLESMDEVDRIVINTDSDQIRTEAPKHFDKVTIHPRPRSLCGDDVSMNRIIADDMQRLEGDLFMQTHSTNPLLRAGTIRRAIQQFVVAGDHDSLLSVTAYHSRFYTADGQPLNHDPTELIRTQDLKPIYEENSCLYIFTRQSFEATGRRIGVHPLMFETPRLESIDIDDPETWALAEAVAAGVPATRFR